MPKNVLTLEQRIGGAKKAISTIERKHREGKHTPYWLLPGLRKNLANMEQQLENGKDEKKATPKKGFFTV